jgi:hypothetical protein
LPDYQELVLNALAALNNLSYYTEASSPIVQRQREVAECEFTRGTGVEVNGK